MSSTNNTQRSKPMSLERAVTAFAGFMVLLSVALTYFVHPAFVWLTVFVGGNLFQQSFTGVCPAGMVMHRLGIRTERELCEAARSRGVFGRQKEADPSPAR